MEPQGGPRRAGVGALGDLGEAGQGRGAGLAEATGGRAAGRLRNALGLGAGTRVLLVCTEGATDPETYHRIVGGT